MKLRKGLDKSFEHPGNSIAAGSAGPSVSTSCHRRGILRRKDVCPYAKRAFGERVGTDDLWGLDDWNRLCFSDNGGFFLGLFFLLHIA